MKIYTKTCHVAYGKTLLLKMSPTLNVGIKKINLKLARTPASANELTEGLKCSTGFLEEKKKSMSIKQGQCL